MVSQSPAAPERAPARDAVGFVDVEVAASDEVTENYLEVERARFDLRVRYDRLPDPPLRAEDAAWVSQLLAEPR